MKRLLFLLLACVAVTVVVGCMTPRPQGYVIGDPPDPLYVLSFDRNGNLENPDDLTTICNKLAAKPQTVIVFVHGWKGSASPNDSNVVKFKDALSKIRAESYKKTGRTLTGVYITYRTLYLKKGFEILTWYPTKWRANSIARGTGIFDAIDKLSREVRRDERDRFVIAGHSLGARILGRVVGFHPEVLRKVDLCILANTADGVHQYEKTLDAVTKSGSPPTGLPKLVWATSAKDRVTGVLYRVANHHPPPAFVENRLDYEVYFVGPDAKDHYSTKINQVAQRPNRFGHNIIVAEGLGPHSDIWSEPMRELVNFYLFHGR
jgi:pimeloyl-ACP methyl ester carboxylesterase